MSLAIFPRLNGEQFHVSKGTRFSTIVNESTSGKTSAVILYTMPLWDFELSYDFILQKQDYGSNIGMVPVTSALLASAGDFIADDFKALVGFHMAAAGRGLTWFYDDPTDDWINGAQIGVGDGTTTQFQAARGVGIFNETIQNVNGTPVLANYWSAGSAHLLNDNLIPSAVSIDSQGGRIATGWQTLGWPNYFKCTTAGVSGRIEPAWRTAPMPGMTISEASTGGTAVWENMDVPLVVFVNGVAQATSAYSIGTTGLITFNSPPAASAPITIVCGFYFQCRFAEDTLTLSELVNMFWTGKSLKFSSEKS